MNILIGCLGSQNAINVVQSLRKVKDFRIVGMDANMNCAGRNLVDVFYTVPATSKSNYLEVVYSIIEVEDIDVFLPIHSAEIEFFCKNREIFSEETSLSLLLPEYTIFKEVNDKFTFFKIVREYFEYFMSSKLITTPDTFSIHNQCYMIAVVELMYDKATVVLKRRVGSGTRNIVITNDIEELIMELERIPNKETYILQQYIKGTEYTIDFICDFDSECIGMVMRERMEVRDGKAVKGKTVYNQQLLDELKTFLKDIRYVGVGNLQCIEKDGVFYLIEFNPRFSAGGLPLTIYVGLDIPLIAVALIDDPSQKIRKFDEYKEGIIMCRYYTENFIDDNIHKKLLHEIEEKRMDLERLEKKHIKLYGCKP